MMIVYFTRKCADCGLLVIVSIHLSVTRLLCFPSRTWFSTPLQVTIGLIVQLSGQTLALLIFKGDAHELLERRAFKMVGCGAVRGMAQTVTHGL